jgi:tetratricopeptide (TPR) repeat protein
VTEPLDQEIRTLRAQFWSARDPEGRAFAPLADAYRRKGELDEAASLVEDGLARLPDFTPGHLVAARIHRARGDLEAARASLDQVLERDGENTLALLSLAEVARDTGDREGAMAGLQRLLALDPQHREARLVLGRMEAGEALGGGAPNRPEPGEPSGPGTIAVDDPFTAEDLLEPDERFLGEEGAASPPAATRDFDTEATPHPDAVTDPDDMPDPDASFPGEAATDMEAPAAPPEGGTATGDLDAYDFEYLVEEDRTDAEEGPHLSLEPELAGFEPEGFPGNGSGGEEAPDALPDEGIAPEEPFVDFARTEPAADGPSPADFALEDLEAEASAEEDAAPGDVASEPASAEDVVPDSPFGEPFAAAPEGPKEDRVEGAGGERAPLVTRTMAEIFVRQGLLGRAVEIYEELVVREPDRTDLEERLEELRGMRAETPEPPDAAPEPPDPAPEPSDPEAHAQGAPTGPLGGAPPTDDAGEAAPQWTEGRDGSAPGDALATPFAWDGGEEDPGDGGGETDSRTIREHFADLLSWVPGAVPVAELSPGAQPAPAPGTSSAAVEDAAPRASPGARPRDPSPAGAVPVEDLAPGAPLGTAPAGSSAAGAVPVEDLAPGAPHETAPEGSLAAGAVPIEDLAPRSDPATDPYAGQVESGTARDGDAADRNGPHGGSRGIEEDLDDFREWLKSLGP